MSRGSSWLFISPYTTLAGIPADTAAWHNASCGHSMAQHGMTQHMLFGDKETAAGGR